MLLLLLTSLAAAAMAQNENPIWFIPSTEKPSSQDEQSFCKAEQSKIADTDLYQTRTSEILLPESLPPAVCIIFPFAPDQLRYGAGTKGDCHNNCCFFRPPSKNIPDAPPNPLWYESSDCNDDSKAENKPIILTGENGEERTVCIQNNEGEFSPVSGATMACARGCCLFFAKEN